MTSETLMTSHVSIENVYYMHNNNVYIVMDAEIAEAKNKAITRKVRKERDRMSSPDIGNHFSHLKKLFFSA